MIEGKKRQKFCKKFQDYLTMDIFYVILEFLELEDILNLSLTSKGKRNFLISAFQLKVPKIIYEPWTIKKALLEKRFKCEEDSLGKLKEIKHLIETIVIEEEESLDQILKEFETPIEDEDDFFIIKCDNEINNLGKVQKVVGSKVKKVIFKSFLTLEKILEALNHFPNLEEIDFIINFHPKENIQRKQWYKVLIHVKKVIFRVNSREWLINQDMISKFLIPLFPNLINQDYEEFFHEKEWEMV